MLRRDCEGISELQEQLKDGLGTEHLSSSSAEEFWVPVELEAAGSPCMAAKDNCTSTHKEQLQGNRCSPLLSTCEAPLLLEYRVQAWNTHEETEIRNPDRVAEATTR